MFFDRPSVRDRQKHFHPGSPRIEESLGVGCSGVYRDGPCWVRLWCDLGFTDKKVTKIARHCTDNCVFMSEK